MVEEHRLAGRIAVLVVGNMPAVLELHQCASHFHAPTLAQSPQACARVASVLRIICMNEYSQPGFGKISVHGDGMGAPTPELVEKRARELALIDERNPDEFTEADWEQARQELLGVAAGGAPEETPENAEPAEEWSEVAADTGTRHLAQALMTTKCSANSSSQAGSRKARTTAWCRRREAEQSQEGGVIEGA